MQLFPPSAVLQSSPPSAICAGLFYSADLFFSHSFFFCVVVVAPVLVLLSAPLCSYLGSLCRLFIEKLFLCLHPLTDATVESCQFSALSVSRFLAPSCRLFLITVSAATLSPHNFPLSVKNVKTGSEPTPTLLTELHVHPCYRLEEKKKSGKALVLIKQRYKPAVEFY